MQDTATLVNTSYTDNPGYFALNGLSAGNYLLKIQLIGFVATKYRYPSRQIMKK